jgi:hypothetical protein
MANATDPVNTCKGDTGSGTATSVSCSTTITPGASGHRFIATAYTFGNPANIAFTLTDTAASSWSSLAESDTAGGAAHIIQMFCTQINSVAAQTFSVSMNQPATSVAITVAEYANLTSCSLDNSLTASSHGNTLGPVGVSAGTIGATTQNDRILSSIFTCTIGSNSSVNSAGSGYTKQISDQFNNTGGGGCIGTNELEDRFAAIGTYSGTWTININSGATFTCGGSTNTVCWAALVVAVPSTSGLPGFRNHSSVIRHKFPWDNRRRKLEIVRI